MADVKKLVPFILKWEGGFVNDPDDLGGATNLGVTYKTYKLYCSRKGRPIPSVDDLKRLTKEEFTDILKTMYWDACKGDEIVSQSVANAVVDWAWHSGTYTAVKELQQVMGLKADGIIGNITLAELNSRSPLPLFGMIQQTRLAYLDRICKARPANQKFMRGWNNRVKSLQFEDL